MKKCKQWVVSFFNENDIEYVKGVGCFYEVHDTIETVKIDAPNGQVYHMAGSRDYGLYIITDNDEHEAMVLLKYSGNITLMRIWWQHEWERYAFS